MPLGEIASGVLGGALRVVGDFFLEVVLEFLIRGPGYWLCKPFKKDVDPDGGLVLLVGGAFWAIVAVGGWLIYREVSESAAIGKCLDAGGVFDRALQKCILS